MGERKRERERGRGKKEKNHRPCSEFWTSRDQAHRDQSHGEKWSISLPTAGDPKILGASSPLSWAGAEA